MRLKLTKTKAHKERTRRSSEHQGASTNPQKLKKLAELCERAKQSWGRGTIASQQNRKVLKQKRNCQQANKASRKESKRSTKHREQKQGNEPRSSLQGFCLSEFLRKKKLERSKTLQTATTNRLSLKSDKFQKCRRQKRGASLPKSIQKSKSSHKPAHVIKKKT